MATKSDGTDDIIRGNLGTGDQGPGDVFPRGKVGPSTGIMPMKKVDAERRAPRAKPKLRAKRSAG